MTSDATPTPTPASLLGQVVAKRYRIRELLGEGGMGAVYLAEHTHMRKRVALKLLHADMSNDPDVLARFRREAEAAARVEHPNVATATDFGQTEDGSFFLVLEYVEGTSLRQALTGGPMPPARALQIARQIALALDRAHGAGVIHRDLKPENVMLVQKGDEADFVKVLDFGIAKVEPHARDSTQPLTRFGTILGTPEYMAPEQALGEIVGPLADLYALGVMLYEMLTGKHPFDAGDRMAILSMHIVAPVPPMVDRNPAVTVAPPIEALVRQLLEKDAKGRPQGARALVVEIEAAAAQAGVDLPFLHSSRSFGRESNADLSRSPSPSAASVRGVPLSTPQNASWSPDDALARTDYGAPVSIAHPGEASIGPRPPGSPSPSRAQLLVANVAKLAEQVSAKVSTLPRNVVLAVGVGAPFLVLGMLLVVLLGRSPASAQSSELDGGAVRASTRAQTAAAERASRAPPEQVAAAAAQGPAALRSLASAYPQDPAVPKRLALLDSAGGRTLDALEAVRSLAKLDASAVDDDVLQIVIRAAQRTDTAEEAFALLEGPLGAAGVDGLVELSTNKSIPASARLRATRSLGRPDIRAKASPAGLLMLDLKSASTCTARKEWVDRAKDTGDGRALVTLKAMRQTHGCGFLGTRDCWACLRHDDTIEESIQAIEAREPRGAR
jgi:serine/threonine-protein kinase